MEGFVAETIGSKMHWNEDFGSKILEGAHRLLRIEVIFPKFRSVVGADGQESNVRLKFFSNLLESFKVPSLPILITAIVQLVKLKLFRRAL